MKRTHLLRVEGDAELFEPLIAALRLDGGRVGWLDLELADPAPADAGVSKAVGVGPRLTIALKPVRGGPVLRDLLREHFRGCRLVLIAGSADASSLARNAPLLAAVSGGWSVTGADGRRTYSTEQLTAALRKPRPFC